MVCFGAWLVVVLEVLMLTTTLVIAVVLGWRLLNDLDW